LGEEAEEELGLLARSDLEGRLVLLDPRVMSVILAQRVIRVFRDPPVLLAPRDLPDLREMLENVDQKDLGVFRVHPDPLVVELEEPRYPAPKDLEDLLVPLDLRENKESRVLPDLRAITDFLAQPEQTVNLDLRVRMARPVLLDLLVPRVLPDLLESVALPVRMR
jgi:hypothetical protein